MTEITPDIKKRIHAAFEAMRATGPTTLVDDVNYQLRKLGTELTELELIAAITTGDPNDVARKTAHMAFSSWDAQDVVDWADGTPNGSKARRDAVYELLEVSLEARQLLEAAFPVLAQRDIVIAEPGPWDPWYLPERRAAHNFYWRAYEGVLARKGWDAGTIASLDRATNDIIGRLADPTSPQSYQSKGLVVGYVQSGKTANFTGIVAKAVDAGYRLIIVMTGTIELLRGQTQRRLDMELIGEENILGGRDRNNPEAIRDVDYIGDDHDADWYADKFLKHGIDINRDPTVPSIKRLTSAKRDYRHLGPGLDTLDFRRTGELKDPSKPLYDPENLYGTDVRIAIIKKNKAALTSLIRDLEDINADSREIPTLIIDDEADQASVNTTNPKRSRKELADRTAINRKISELLKLLPRAQYLGYTATPFANVFVSPDDVADIFPKDFIISLEPSAEYMGGKQFHDLAPVASDPSGSGMSNEEAHVRALLAGGGADDDAAEREEMQEALDAFVLSGAIKLWRQEHVDGLSFRHHTMLVHESVKQAEHKDLADMVRDVWATSDFSGPGGLARLRELYLADFVKVHAARDWGAPLPADFDELLPHLGEALVEILADGDPVVIVNGSKDSDYDAMDFSRRPYWRIMVGGAKLSRGFTVEGLTVSYYRRRAMAADTLMQMGRWFGYRPGYRDLVRLYIGRDVIDGRGKSFDLYDAFTAILEDEEEFRDQLRAFAALDDEGRPVVLPRNVPPMVFSQLSWLKPTGTNRMYNAVLKMMARGGQLKDRFNMPAHGEKKHEHNLRLALKLIDVPGQRRELLQTKSDSIRFPARVSFRSAQEVLAVLKNMAWGSHIDPDIQFMLDAISRGTLNDFAIVLPELDDAKRRTVLEVDLPIIQRKRRAGRGDFSGSEPKHRGVIEYIAGNPETWTNPDIEEGAMIPDCRYDDNREPSLADDAGRRGAILINFAYESSDGRYLVKDLPDEVPPQDVVTLISIAMPYASAPRGRIAFQVRDAGHPDAVTVDV